MKQLLKQSSLLLTALLLAVGGTLYAFTKREKTLPAGSWGLSFQEEGQAPVGNATPEQLRAYDGFFVGDSRRKVIYLTFDAGYENGCTEKILDTLKKHNVKAAFFLVGNYLEQNQELVRRLAAEGHTVGNHTWHHWDMSRISDAETFRQELESMEKCYEEVTGEKMSKFYRPPQGIYSEENLKMAQKLGYHTIFWSLAYVDWLQEDQPTREQAFSKLIPRIHPGAVVLLHSTSRTNADILDELLTRWEDMGYSFGTLDELTSETS